MKKIEIFRSATLATLLFFTPRLLAAEALRFWVGASEAGIYAGELDTGTGEITKFGPVAEGFDAYYIVKHPQKPILYAVIRTQGPGKIASFNIAESGALHLQSQLDNRPHGVSHVNISDDGRLLGAAYYRAGVAGVYGLNDDGSINSDFYEAQHQGRSVDSTRQEAPHPHWAGFSADSRYMYVPDLGTDHIWVYAVDRVRPSLRVVQKSAAPAGSGPRHMAIHPDLDIAYVSDELKSRVSRYAIDRNNGSLRYLDSMAPAEETLEESWHSVSDIRVHPSGQFLYLINRGLDRISVFTINAETGELLPVQREPVRGTISRNIVFTDDGRWALVAGRDSNTLALFEVSTETGKLRYAHKMVSVPTPMAIVIETPD